MKNIDISIATTIEDLYEMINVRKSVFVEEQNIPESKEFDGNDFTGTHILAKINNQTIGAMRIRYFGDFVKFERMAVLKEHRNQVVSEQIMQAGIDFVSQKGFRTIRGLCKKELLPRWEKSGYEEIKGADHVKQNGIELIQIAYKIPENPHAIKLTDHPSILNKLEGNWQKAERSEKNDKISQIIQSLKNKQNPPEK